jgi:hypothetical protein
MSSVSLCRPCNEVFERDYLNGGERKVQAVRATHRRTVRPENIYAQSTIWIDELQEGFAWIERMNVPEQEIITQGFGDAVK